MITKEQRLKIFNDYIKLCKDNHVFTSKLYDMGIDTLELKYKQAKDSDILALIFEDEKSLEAKELDGSAYDMVSWWLYDAPDMVEENSEFDCSSIKNINGEHIDLSTPEKLFEFIWQSVHEENLI